jgi:hypothetical protein
MPLYVIERNLMQSAFGPGRSVGGGIRAYIRKLLQARLPATQKALLLVWALAFVVPLTAWRRHLVLVRRSPLNRSPALQKLVSALTRFSGDVASVAMAPPPL